MYFLEEFESKFKEWAGINNKKRLAGELLEFDEVEIIAIIMDPEETEKILRHLINTGKSPPNYDPGSLN